MPKTSAIDERCNTFVRVRMRFESAPETNIIASDVAREKERDPREIEREDGYKEYVGLRWMIRKKKGERRKKGQHYVIMRDAGRREIKKTGSINISTQTHTRTRECRDR